MSNKFKKSIKLVAKELDKHPSDVTKVEYTNSQHALSEWELRKFGGFGALKSLFYKKEVDLVFKSGSALVKSHRNKLEKKYGTEIFLKEEFFNLFKDVLSKNPLSVHKSVKLPKASSPASRTLVIHFSDTHYGCNIDKGELNGINEFNWTIAARRTAAMIKQAVTYKPQHRDNTDLVVAINGDIIAGVIHDQEWAVDLLTTQFAGALSIFTQGISYAAQHFKNVRVVCTAGNHGRAMHKSSKDRALTHKWDAYETMLYVALREALASHKNISFQIPESPYAVADIQGHKILITHGDTVINLGNPGNSLDMKRINYQIKSINSDMLNGKGKFAAIMGGHVHVPTIQLTESGTILLVNGTLSGTDAFAQGIGIFGNNPSQTMFEVTKEHAVGDIRFVQLKDADNKPELEKIIKPFKGKF